MDDLEHTGTAISAGYNRGHSLRMLDAVGP